MSATRVLLAEGQPMVRAGFRALLESRADVDVVGEAATGHKHSSEPEPCAPTWSSWTSECPRWTGSGFVAA
jgi:hypothetical protein